MTKKVEEKKENKENKEIWVFRKKANLVTICLGEELDLRIFPGNTRISNPEILEALNDPKRNQGWQSLVKAGAITIIESKDENSDLPVASIPFTQMKVRDAINLIQGLFSVAELEQMLSEEQSKASRGSVIDAIKDQIKQLKDSTNEPLSDTKNQGIDDLVDFEN